MECVGFGGHPVWGFEENHRSSSLGGSPNHGCAWETFLPFLLMEV